MPSMGQSAFTLFQILLTLAGTIMIAYVAWGNRQDKLISMAKESFTDLAKLEKKIADIEAMQDEESRIHQADLEQFGNVIAAQVGEEVQDIADEVMSAMYAHKDGEDVGGMLREIHNDLLCLYADLESMGQDREI